MDFRTYFKGSKIAVTGGAGFIGSHLVHKLSSLEPSEIRIIDSLKYGRLPKLQSSNSTKLILHQCSLGHTTPEKLDAALQDIDYLFHLAAEKHNSCLDDPMEVYRANISGSHQLYESAIRSKVRRCVFSSSLYAYGKMSGDPMREDDPAQPITAYGISKLAGEHIAHMLYKQQGLPCVILRYFFAYGPRQYIGMGYKSVIIRNFERLLRGESPIVRGDGCQELDYIYIDDLIRTTLAAMCSNVSFDIFNVGSGHRTSILSLVKTMMEVFGEEKPLLFEPPDFTANTSRVGNITKAASLLGHHCDTGLKHGLSHTLAWMRRNTL